jgi:hypothetical protein
MPKYRVLQKSFIGNRIVEPDEIVEYDGAASGNLAPVEGTETAAVAPVEAPRRGGRKAPPADEGLV